MNNERKEKLEYKRKKLENQLQHLIKITPNLLGPLKDLNERQIVATVALGYLVQSILQAKSSVLKLDKNIINSFEKELVKISPILPHAIRGANHFADCFGYDTDYISALANCEKDGRSEDECHEAWGLGGAAVMCRMEKINELGKYIEDILGGLIPPRPSPWPEIPY